jgi:hypothetical protein
MIAAVLFAAATGAAYAPESTTVPFALFDNRMLVRTMLDGKGPFTMIVDTGTYTVTVTPLAAQRLGLATQSGGSAFGAGSNSVRVGTAHLKSLEIGALRFENLHADVLDLTTIQHTFGFPHLDGIIGYSILGKLRVGIDMDSERLTLSYAPLPIPKSAASVSFTINDYDIPQIAAAVDGVPGTFVIDTGDRSSLTLFRRFAQANDFYRDAPVRNAITGVGIGGPIYSDVMRTSVSLFGATIPGVVTRASRDRGGVFATATQAASIGTGLLKCFNLVFDYPEKRIFAWHSRFFGEPDEYRPLALVNGKLQVSHPAIDPTVTSTGASHRPERRDTTVLPAVTQKRR